MASEQAKAKSVEAIKQTIPGDVLTSAEEAGVDVDETINENLTKHGDYSARTIARFVQSDLRDRVEAEKADEMSGIIMGCRDRFGENWPRRWSLVKSDGQHLQFSTWDGELDGPDGGSVEIPTGGAAVQLRLGYDDQYDSWEGKRIESVHHFDHDELVENLQAVAVSPTFLSRGDEEEIVVVQGKVAFINPQTVFAGDDQEDWYDGEVLQESEHGDLLPHFELSFDTGGDEYRVRGHFMRQRFAKPYIQVPDLGKLCHDAVRHRDDPEAQARFVQDGLRGEEVIAVGRVNNFTTNREEETGEVVNYVDIGMSALVSMDSTQQLSIDEAADVDESEPEPVTEPEPPTEPAETGESEVVAEVRSDIEKYCELTGTDIGTLTVEDVHENIQGVDAPDVAIRQALGGESEPADEPADDPAGDDEGGPEDVHGYDDLPFKPEDHTVPEVEDLVGDVDDKETLVNLSAAERAGKDRKTAKEAINNRADELVDDGGFEPDPDADDPWEAIEGDGLYHCPGSDPDDADQDCLAQAGSTGELVGHIIDDHNVTGDPRDWVQSQVEG